MKVNWFTPLPPARSDIASYVERILPALQRHAEVVLWTDQPKAARSVRRLAEVRHYRPGHLKYPDINHADFTVYNVGNDVRFHGALMNVARRHPGIVILHDLSVHELALESLRLEPAWRERYLELMATCGADALADAQAHIDGQMSIDEIATRHPLTDWAFEGAHGVVVHNEPLFRELCPGPRPPVLGVPLPYLPAASLLPPRAHPRGKGPLELVICGHLNSANRRLHVVLDALAAFPRRASLRLHICGTVADADALKQRIAGRGLSGQVKQYGFVPERKLTAILERMHVAINLRNPTRGEASGAQLRFWNHSLPTLVSRTGWYGRLPAGSVLHVSTDDEQRDLHAHWDRALDDYEALAQTGLRGRAELEARHSAETYAAALMDFLPTVSEYRRRAFAPHMAARAGAALAQMRLPPAALDLAASSVGRIIEKIARPVGEREQGPGTRE